VNIAMMEITAGGPLQIDRELSRFRDSQYWYLRMDFSTAGSRNEPFRISTHEPPFRL
jgi:hypothetical protein